MIFKELALPGVVLVSPRVFGDERGFFMETWEARKFAGAGITASFVQDNHSKSSRGTLRGLHYQIEHPQGKLVRVVSGEVFDVCVDMRRSSPRFGEAVSVVLSSENRHMLWVPPGFAHGFLVTSESAEFVYKCTDFWLPAAERTLLWNDPDLQIDWPRFEGPSPLLSEKDRAGTPLRLAERFP